MIQVLSSALFLNMLRGGAANLAQNRERINELNVFPIPDGDTGDNMYMTIEAGTHATGDSLGALAHDASSRMLLGARGNSGVILSRIFAGMEKGFNGCQKADIKQFATAMQAAVEEAYHAVSKPVEGTMLTVLREGVEAANKEAASFEEYLDLLVRGMEKSLEGTPLLLEVLAKAGVVDSGGAGLVCIAEGMRAALSQDFSADHLEGNAVQTSTQVDFSAFTEDSVLEFGYCTEFLLRLQRSKIAHLEHFDESVIKDYLLSQGDSLVFFRDGSIVKVHVHTMDPGAVLSHCRVWGEFLTIKVENMTLQHHENHMDQRFAQARKALGIVAVASGDGLRSTFIEMGAHEVIEGGQTMNPPVEAFLKAFEKVNADTVLVFPNNSNILLTARQAASLYQGSEVVVIPTETLGEGYYALANLDAELPAEELEKSLTQAAKSVTTGAVSRAIRDTETAFAGDYIGFVGKDILSAAGSRKEAAKALAKKLLQDTPDIFLLFPGADTPQEEAETLKAGLENASPLTEVILIPGGQPVYDYIFVKC